MIPTTLYSYMRKEDIYDIPVQFRQGCLNRFVTVLTEAHQSLTTSAKDHSKTLDQIEGTDKTRVSMRIARYEEEAKALIRTADKIKKAGIEWFELLKTSFEEGSDVDDSLKKLCIKMLLGTDNEVSLAAYAISVAEQLSGILTSTEEMQKLLTLAKKQAVKYF